MRVHRVHLTSTYTTNIAELARAFDMQVATIPQVGIRGWWDYMEDWDVAWDPTTGDRAVREGRLGLGRAQRGVEKERWHPLLFRAVGGVFVGMAAAEVVLGMWVDVVVDEGGS